MIRKVLCGALALAAMAPAARAALVLNDTFDGPDATRGHDAGNPLDVAFYSFTPGASLGVVSDGETAYLAVHAPANSLFGTAAFPAVTLANVGDRLSFRFLVRGTGSNLPEFRIGIYNSLGTSPSDDSAESRATAADDQGIRLNLLDDPGLFYSGTIGADVSGQTLTDYEGGGFIGGLRFADGQWHSVEIQLYRNAIGVAARFLYDGDQRTDSPFFNLGVSTFDNIQFGTAASSVDMQLDNVAVEFTPVPEPAGLAGMALGAAALAGRRRRK